ncbi:dihydrodipicolinate synthase family protein [bacterium]|nr:dihydrodipicolinate synthase family protein [bacterium]
METLAPQLSALLRQGTVIPAHPLALTPDLRLDERHQRGLTRYYCAAGVGGVAVGVHTTQFEIHAPAIGLLEPVLALASRTVDESLALSPRPFIKIAGLLGRTEQALREADLALSLGYHVGMLSLSAWREAPLDELLAHCRAVADRIPVMGFYLQPAVGGRVLDYEFWRRFVEIDNVVAIKVAPFSRYQTLDVVRALAASGRSQEIALYTGNDDSIIADLITDFVFDPNQPPVQFVGGLLGQWAVWTHRVVQALNAIQHGRATGTLDSTYWLTYGAQLTDANAAIFDPVHSYRGCIPGIHWVLQHQGLMQGAWTLNPQERLAPGQVEEIKRVCAAYPHLNDDDFVAAHRDEWLD